MKYLVMAIVAASVVSCTQAGFMPCHVSECGTPANVSSEVVVTHDATVRLEDRQFYEDSGYLKIPGFFNSDEVAQLLEYTRVVEETPEEKGGQMMYFERSLHDGERILRRVEDFGHRQAGLQSMLMAKDSKLVSFTSDLIGEDVLLFKEKINFKLPGATGFKAHQDHQAGWGKYVNWFVSVGVCLDPATVENGCLEIAAGFHKDGLLGEEWKPIEDLPLPYEHVECEPGDVLVFDSYVPHRSGDNLTSQRRRMLFLTYNKEAEGDHRREYFDDKRVEYPPDIERRANDTYVYRV